MTRVSNGTGSGPVASTPNLYREYKAFAQNNPVGFLPNDQTHRLRLYASYDQKLGAFGDLNVSVLERWDSGTAYSAFANVQVRSYVENPGYATPPRTATYFFSDRGAFRTDDVTATDLALNWTLPITRVQLFIQGEILNVFNEQAVIAPSTTVNVLGDFNPFTETPVEGVHWEKDPTFGQAIDQASYQLPRTYRFSAGFRF